MELDVGADDPGSRRNCDESESSSELESSFDSSVSLLLKWWVSRVLARRVEEGGRS